MTNIQIEYWKTKELGRHNQATESQAKNELAETSRHNYAFETETRRHNVAGERENTRHNKVTEKETQRSNKARETLTKDQNTETKRHNVATERETNRSNIVNESIKRDTLTETKRHNVAGENLTARDIANKERGTESTIRRNEVQNRKDNAAAEDIEWLNNWRKQYPNSAVAQQLTKGLSTGWVGDLIRGAGLSADGVEWLLDDAIGYPSSDDTALDSLYTKITGNKQSTYTNRAERNAKIKQFFRNLQPMPLDH